MTSRGGDRRVAGRSTSRPRALGRSPWMLAGIVATALLAWPTTLDLRRRSNAHHPDRARRDRRPRRVFLRLGVPTRDRPRHSEAIGGNGHYGRTSRHRPDRCDGRIPAGGSTFTELADRPGQAPLVRFGPLQHSLVAARCPADANLPDDPASAFSPPARALFADRNRRRPPVRFCARGGRGSVSLVWRTGSGFSLVFVA